MTQNVGTLNPSRGNRRFILLAIVLGLMGAGLVYVATSRSTATAPPLAVPSFQPVPVVVAKVDVPARTRLRQEMLDVRLLQPEALSPLAFTDVRAAVGQVTRYPLTAGEQVMTSKVVDARVGGSLSFVIPEGRRAFAISVTNDGVATAGGLVLPGDYVDIVILGDSDGGPSVETLFQNIEVLAVAQMIVDVVEVPVEAEAGATGAQAEVAEGSTQRVRNREAPPVPNATTVTLALTPEEVERIYRAEASGRIRLAVRPFGEDEIVDIGP